MGNASPGAARELRLDARHERDTSDAKLQRADLAGARGLRPPECTQGQDEHLSVHRTDPAGERPRALRRENSAVLLEGVAFIHDDTGDLTATGYTASQDEQLPEFVFGRYDAWQRSLAWIEEKAGVSFGALTQLDAAGHAEEMLSTTLTSFEQIRLRA